MHSGRSAQTSFSRVAQEAVGLMPVSRIMHGTGIGDRLPQDMRWPDRSRRTVPVPVEFGWVSGLPGKA